MRLFALFISLFFCAVSALAQSHNQPMKQPMDKPGFHRVSFEFHSAFLMNLHHFLYDLAVREGRLEKTLWQQQPSESEMQTLRDAIRFYQVNYAKKDLLFDAEMGQIKRALSVSDTSTNASLLALPPALIDSLNRVSPMYARCIWGAQDQSNRRWIRQVAELDASYGAEIQENLEKFLGLPFPRSAIRVDVVVDSGTFEGAYTDARQIVLPSGRRDYAALASLEMLYHEATHTQVTDKVAALIEAELKKSRRSTDSSLWHALQFYTVGKVVQDTYKLRGKLDYQPYADHRIFKTVWSSFVAPITQFWLPYMQGKVSMETATEGMVDLLSAD